jgi:CO dehydrogenase/acetyl-CoA synthase beta subunit
MLQLLYERSYIAGFLHLNKKKKIDMALTIKSCEADRNFSELSVIKNKFRSTILMERLNCLFVVSVENDIKLSYEEAIKEYAAKKCRENCILLEVCQAVT